MLHFQFGHFDQATGRRADMKKKHYISILQSISWIAVTDNSDITFSWRQPHVSNGNPSVLVCHEPTLPRTFHKPESVQFQPNRHKYVSKISKSWNNSRENRNILLNKCKNEHRKHEWKFRKNNKNRIIIVHCTIRKNVAKYHRLNICNQNKCVKMR